MKKILVLTMAMMTIGSTAFASCPISGTNTSCSINHQGNITGAAAPVSYIIAPAPQQTMMQRNNNWNTAQPKRNMFQKMMTPFNSVYNTIFVPFTNLYD